MTATILVADDDAAIRTVLNQALSRAGYDVRITANAATLWRWVSSGDGDLVLTSAYRPGMRMSVAGSQEKISLPLEFCVHDNGPGVPQDLMSHLFDPFITTKPNGTGLGLALVAKIIGGHGGIVECDSASGRTTFRILMPVSKDVAAMPSAQMDEKSGKEQ